MTTVCAVRVLEGTVYNEDLAVMRLWAPNAIESRWCFLRALYSRKETIIRAPAIGTPTPAPTIALCCMQTLEVTVILAVEA